MLYIVVKGVPAGHNNYGIPTNLLAIGNIFGIFKNRYNAEFLKEYYENDMGTGLDILEVHDDDSIKGLMMNENLKRLRGKNE